MACFQGEMAAVSEDLVSENIIVKETRMDIKQQEY